MQLRRKQIACRCEDADVRGSRRAVSEQHKAASWHNESALPHCGLSNNEMLRHLARLQNADSWRIHSCAVLQADLMQYLHRSQATRKLGVSTDALPQTAAAICSQPPGMYFLDHGTGSLAYHGCATSTRVAGLHDRWHAVHICCRPGCTHPNQHNPSRLYLFNPIQTSKLPAARTSNVPAQ